MSTRQSKAPKGNILIVDDTPENLRLLSNALTEQGYKVRSVIDGAMALMGARTAPPDLILLDINMPTMNGYEVCEALKADEKTREIPVIFISALDEVLDKVKGFAVGGRDYITKPFQVEEVLARVKNQLTLRSLQKKLTEQNSQLRHLEAELRLALEKEKELSQLRSEFMSLISHEFRTPLTTILSSDQLLQRYGKRLSDEKQQNHHERIQNAVGYMTQLLDDVLLIGTAEAGKLKFEPTLIDLVAFCRDLVETLQMNTNQHKLLFVSDSEELYAQMDKKLLGHIFTNLLSNAIKFSPKGGIVQFDLVSFSESVILRIQDNGIGIPAKDLPQLFESFSRASNVDCIQGTGLGLTIVKKSVDLHGGQIAVESEVGIGTTFTVTLPLNDSG